MPRRRSRRIRFGRILQVLFLLVVAAVTAAYWYERPMLLTGTGYAAHNACALQHIAGRTKVTEDLPPNPLVPVLRTETTDDGAVEASILGLLAKQKAWYTKDFGCALGAEAPSLGRATPVTAAVPATGPAADAASVAALAKAFGDDLPAADKKRLGTRGIVVLRDGKLVAERYAPGFDSSTKQLGWSMSKSVANMLVGVLVRDGTVAVSDSGLRPEWTDGRKAITLEQLMRMDGGLTWDENYALGTPVTTMLYREGDMGAYAASLPLAHAPGTYQQYSSGSTNIVCSILHARTGLGADLPRRKLFAPLGIGSAVWEPDMSGTPVCSSYLWATPRDWARLGQFALQQGAWEGRQLLPQDWIAWSTKHTTIAGEETGYAVGWWVNRLADGRLVFPQMPADTYWMQGHDGQRVYVVPSAGLVVARLGFSPELANGKIRTEDLVRDLVAAGAR